MSELKTEEVKSSPSESKEAKKESIKKIEELIINGKESVEKIETILKNNNNKTKKQEAKGLKIMTPDQLISRLPILLAQKQAGNNSQKLNNEIRQIIYFL